MKTLGITLILLTLLLGSFLATRPALEEEMKSTPTPKTRTVRSRGDQRALAPATNREAAYHNRTRASDLMAQCDQAVRDREGPLMTKEESRWAMDLAWAVYIHKCHEIMHLTAAEEQPDWMRRGLENHPNLEQPKTK